MANKNNKSAHKPEKNYIDLLYMTSQEISAKDIASLMSGNGLTVQLWEEMNVLELELSTESSLDFEPLDINFKEPSDAAFVKNRGIRTIFAIRLCDADLQAALPCFEQLVNGFGGFVCADSEDFTPVYAGSSKKA